MYRYCMSYVMFHQLCIVLYVLSGICCKMYIMIIYYGVTDCRFHIKLLTLHQMYIIACVTQYLCIPCHDTVENSLTSIRTCSSVLSETWQRHCLKRDKFHGDFQTLTSTRYTDHAMRVIPCEHCSIPWHQRWRQAWGPLS